MNPKLLILPQLGAVVLTGLLCGLFLAFALDVAPALQFLGSLTLVVLWEKVAAPPRYVIRQQQP